MISLYGFSLSKVCGIGLPKNRNLNDNNLNLFHYQFNLSIVNKEDDFFIFYTN